MICNRFLSIYCQTMRGFYVQLEEYYLHLELGLALGDVCIYQNRESQMSRYLLKMKC